MPLVLSLLLSFYFAWHGYYGQRGYRKWQELKLEYGAALAVKKKVGREKEKLALNVSLMYAPKIDRDLLDEAARRILNYADKDDLIIFD